MATPTNLPASFSTGAVLTAAQMNDLRGAFRILQVVSTQTATATVSTSTTYADATNLSVTITPQATSSKVLIVAAIQTGHANSTGGFLRLLRGSTAIGIDPAVWFYTGNANSEYSGQSNSIIYLDSPNTTSATTYKIQFRKEGGADGVAINRSYIGAAGQVGASTITALEISA